MVLDAEWDPSYFSDRILFDEWPKHEAFRVVMLDPSVGETSGGDYAACLILCVDQSGHIWVDGVLDRMDAWKQVELVLKMATSNSVVAVGIEGNAFQKVLVGMFRRRCRQLGYWPNIHVVTSQKEKKMKIRAAVTPFLSAGSLHFKKNSPGVSLLLEQLRNFPGFKYDDGPDCLAMGLELCAHLHKYGAEDSGDDIHERAFA